MKCVERVTGIEPAYRAWEARVLPLNYTRSRPQDSLRKGVLSRSVLYKGECAPGCHNQANGDEEPGAA